MFRTTTGLILVIIKQVMARAVTLNFALFLLLFPTQLAFAQSTTPLKPTEKTAESENKDAPKRSDVNVLGKTDSSSGESRRNENVQFNLIDNNSLKESNLRLGTSATITSEFAVDKNYFGSEFGNAPKASITVPPKLKAGMHGELRYSHVNSVFNARSFFQVGSVKPSRENEYGFNFGSNLWRNAKLFIDGGQTKIRGSVNGNVLVPKPDERTPLTSDPLAYAFIARLLAAYPKELPNRTEINVRALNTNSPQAIDNTQANIRLDQKLRSDDNLIWQYQFSNQKILAFQFVAGQNPNTDNKTQLARIGWTRQWNPNTVSNFSVSYDRLKSVLSADKNAVGPFILIQGLAVLGPIGTIPINRVQNQIKYGGQVRRLAGNHTSSFGFNLIRKQINGIESDAHRGVFSFSNDFGRDAITNLRMGTATQYLVSITPNLNRGFRFWDMLFFAGDQWQVNKNLTLNYGLRYQPVTRPVEVNNLNKIAYGSDLNNFAPSIGFAYRLPKSFGVLRSAAAVHFGEIFTPTFQQIRFTPPGNNKVTIPSPNLVNPLGTSPISLTQPNLYLLDPELATPYSYQYNLSWEPNTEKILSKRVKVQLGYVGSRAHKLLVMWYLNRARPVDGIDQITKTVNLRRPNQAYSDIREIVNGSRGYFDAGRASIIFSGWKGFSTDASYWFSKAIDLGASYLNTAYDDDSRKSRSQSEFETQKDMKGLSLFDQTHAFLWRTNYSVQTPKEFGWLNRGLKGWNFSTIVLIKTGIPFDVVTGSDGPGFGNVDGNGNDRPNLLDPSILGRTIANPDTSTKLLPRSAFATIKPTESRGNLGRGVFRKGPIHNVNASLSRSWSFQHDMKISFRAESINLFNTPQFAEPGFELGNQNFGQITNTLNDGRTFRFGLQVGW